MICPYCDSLLKEIPESGTCPNCGGTLKDRFRTKVQRSKWNYPDAPKGVYKDAAGYLEIEENGITFYRNQWPFAAKTVRTIPYSEIVAVSYKEGDFYGAGYLCVREWQDRHSELVSNASKAVLDKTSVYFNMKHNRTFLKVYQFLQNCVSITKSAMPYTCDVEKEALIGKYEGQYCYMELGEKGVLFSKAAPLVGNRMVPYDEIAEVKLKRAKGFKAGGLSVRQRNDGKSLDKALRNEYADDTTFAFLETANEKMLTVYSFLMDCVRENADRWSL